MSNPLNENKGKGTLTRECLHTNLREMLAFHPSRYPVKKVYMNVLKSTCFSRASIRGSLRYTSSIIEYLHY